MQVSKMSFNFLERSRTCQSSGMTGEFAYHHLKHIKENNPLNRSRRITTDNNNFTPSLSLRQQPYPEHKNSSIGQRGFLKRQDNL